MYSAGSKVCAVTARLGLAASGGRRRLPVLAARTPPWIGPGRSLLPQKEPSGPLTIYPREEPDSSKLVRSSARSDDRTTEGEWAVSRKAARLHGLVEFSRLGGGHLGSGPRVRVRLRIRLGREELDSRGWNAGDLLALSASGRESEAYPPPRHHPTLWLRSVVNVDSSSRACLAIRVARQIAERR